MALARRRCTVCLRREVKVHRRWITDRASPMVPLLHRHRWQEVGAAPEPARRPPVEPRHQRRCGLCDEPVPADAGPGYTCEVCGEQ